ncbi:hypothetical protein Ancab_019508 [Ancistrocladus abbreviatus]
MDWQCRHAVQQQWRPSTRSRWALSLSSLMSLPLQTRNLLSFKNNPLGQVPVLEDDDLTIFERVVWISVAILILLFSVQRFGTDKVSYSFARIICVWFAINASIGLFNLIKYDPTVIKALNPWNIVEYFKRNGKEARVSLGGVVLCITVRSIEISTCTVRYPALILAYSGQATYLRKETWGVSNTSFKAVPVAVLAAIIASQAMISGTLSILQQSLSLGCFPRVKVVHTSTKYEGQVYMPEVSFILMVACVCVTLAFKTTEKIGNAYETEAEGDEDGINNNNDEERQGEGEGMNNGELEKEIEVLEKAYKKGAGLEKKVLINCGHNFLKKNLRQSDPMFDVPRGRLLKIGMTYEL